MECTQDTSLKTILEKLNKIEQILVEKKKPFLTLDEASKYLGISKNTLYGYTSKNLITFYKPQNRRIYFKIDDLDNFILNKRNRSQGLDEIKKESLKH